MSKNITQLTWFSYGLMFSAFIALFASSITHSKAAGSVSLILIVTSVVLFSISAMQYEREIDRT